MVHLENIHKYTRPTSINKALSFLKDNGRKAFILAGGTSLTYIRLPQRITTIVDITDLNLDHITTNETHYAIGSLNTINRLLTKSQELLPFKDIFLAASRATATYPTRNLITIGGNALATFSWSIFPVVLQVLDADFVFGSHDNERIVHAHEIYRAHPSKAIGDSEILREIRIPRDTSTNGTKTLYYFKKFSQTATEFSWATLGTAIRVGENMNIEKARISVGALSPLPQRLTTTEEFLEGKCCSNGLLDELIDVASGEIAVKKDTRCSKDYKNTLFRAMLREMWESVSGKGSGNGQ